MAISVGFKFFLCSFIISSSLIFMNFCSSQIYFESVFHYSLTLYSFPAHISFIKFSHSPPKCAFFLSREQRDMYTSKFTKKKQDFLKFCRTLASAKADAGAAPARNLKFKGVALLLKSTCVRTNYGVSRLERILRKSAQAASGSPKRFDLMRCSLSFCLSNSLFFRS